MDRTLVLPVRWDGVWFDLQRHMLSGLIYLPIAQAFIIFPRQVSTISKHVLAVIGAKFLIWIADVCAYRSTNGFARQLACMAAQYIEVNGAIYMIRSTTATCRRPESGCRYPKSTPIRSDNRCLLLQHQVEYFVVVLAMQRRCVL